MPDLKGPEGLGRLTQEEGDLVWFYSSELDLFATTVQVSPETAAHIAKYQADGLGVTADKNEPSGQRKRILAADFRRERGL